MIVLDTNVVSELFRPARLRDSHVNAWFSALAAASVSLNRVTEAEIWAGAYGHRDRRQSEMLFEYWRDLAGRLAILEFDAIASRLTAQFMGHRRRAGRPVSFADAAIAGIALANDCSVATRNTKDFEGSGLILVNPFDPVRDEPPQE